MKLNKTLWALLSGAFFNLGIVPGEGGSSDADAAAAAQALADATAATAAATQAAEDAKNADAGKKAPTDEEARLLKENMKRKDENRKIADEKTALEAKLKAFEGIDPEAVRKLLGEQKNAEDAKLAAEGNWDRLKSRMAEEHGKEVDLLKAQMAALQGDFSKATGTINDLSIGSKFSTSTFIADELTLTPSIARVVYASHFDLSESGEVVGYDKPRGEANRTALVDQYGSPVGFDDAFRKIIMANPEKDHLLKSKVKPGASSESKKSSTPPADNAITNSVDKISAGLKGLNIGKQ